MTRNTVGSKTISQPDNNASNNKSTQKFSLLTIPKDPLNIDLKIDVDIDLINQRYGIQPKEKLGDIIIETH